MKIGITFDLKDHQPVDSFPDDFQEEFDSPRTVEAIAQVLRSAGHDVVLLGDGPGLVARLLAENPDFVFNFAEGEGISRCREARVPALLEILGIPYTGSDPLCLSATLDKDVARRLVASYGVTVPRGFLVPPVGQPSPIFGGSPSPSQFPNSPLNMPTDVAALAAAIPFPAVVKPAWEGSSKGIRQTSLVHDYDSLVEAIGRIHRLYHQPALVEEYIAGEELTVGVIGNDPPQVIGILHIIPRQPSEHFLYSLEVKRDYRQRVRYESPPQLPPQTLRKVAEAALVAFRALACRDVCRIDFRLRSGEPCFLEANPLPGLHPEDSDLVILAQLNGWSYSQLILSILEAAQRRSVSSPLIRPRCPVLQLSKFG